ncbi:MAG: hypothetical protein R6U64_10135 [Bacteroidales bacterium]
MKERMTLINKTERLGGLVVLVLIAARILIGPEMNVALRLSLTLLAVFYMWFGFFIFNRTGLTDLITRKRNLRLNPFRITSSIIMGLLYSFCMISLIFSFYFLRGMHVLIGLSTVLVVVATLLMGTYQWIHKAEAAYIRQFYLRSALFAILGFAFLATPLQTRLEVLYGNHPDFVEAYMNYYQNPREEQAIENLRETRSRFR